MSTPFLRTRLAAPLAAVLLAGAAQAAPIPNPFLFDEFGGPDSPAMSGGLLFSPDDGIGGWIGVLQGIGPMAPTFDTLVSFNAMADGAGGFGISGDFDFIFRDIDGLTPDDDTLTGTLVGTLMTDAGDPALRRVSVLYTVVSGSGLFAGFSGFGSSMFSYNASGDEPYSYAGSGQLRLQDPALVSAPGTLALAALALLAAGGVRRAAPAATTLRLG
jgi:hypothetical protein